MRTPSFRRWIVPTQTQHCPVVHAPRSARHHSYAPPMCTHQAGEAHGHAPGPVAERREHLATSRATRADNLRARAAASAAHSPEKWRLPAPKDRTWHGRGVDQTRVRHSALPRPPQHRRRQKKAVPSRWLASSTPYGRTSPLQPLPPTHPVANAQMAAPGATRTPLVTPASAVSSALGVRFEKSGVAADQSSHSLSLRPGSPTLLWIPPSD